MIKKDTLTFLKDIKVNNNRDWFLANKPRYEAAREDVIAFTAELIQQLSKIDPDVSADTDPKKCVMRIYRDIRFRIDKTPYKTNFGISIMRQTRNGEKGAEYYIQIEPGNTFVAGGRWMPEAPHLKLIRQEIDYNAGDLKKIIDAPQFIKLFGNFRDQEKLKTIPRDYTADNENIELLKLKSFIAFNKLKDSELTDKDIIEKVTAICGEIYPLNVFLNNAIA